MLAGVKRYIFKNFIQQKRLFWCEFVAWNESVDSRGFAANANSRVPRWHLERKIETCMGQSKPSVFFTANQMETFKKPIVFWRELSRAWHQLHVSFKFLIGLIHCSYDAIFTRCAITGAMQVANLISIKPFLQHIPTGWWNHWNGSNIFTQQCWIKKLRGSRLRRALKAHLWGNSLTIIWYSSWSSIGSDITFFIDPIGIFSVRSIWRKNKPIISNFLFNKKFHTKNRSSGLYLGARLRAGMSVWVQEACNRTCEEKKNNN